MVKTFSFPSVYESTIREYYTSNDPILGFSKIKVDDSDYLVGLQALNEGVSPHKSLNASPSDREYKLIAHSALFLASNIGSNGAKNGNSPKFSITTGFPYATYQLNKESAIDFFKSDCVITTYKADENGNQNPDQKLVPICNINVLPEIVGCDYAIRKGDNPSDGNFIIVSLGYGTCECVVSTPNGLLNRTLFSTHGMSYAVDIFSQELSKSSFIGLKTGHQMDQIFTKGGMYIDRKHKDFSEEKKKALRLYFNNVILPSFTKYITDSDFELCPKMILVGGGAYNQELINLFNEEFGEICSISVFPTPERCASIGYAIFSKHTDNEKSGNEFASTYDAEGCVYIGIDIGNANTCVSVLEG
jgi:hypothetical protein